MISVYSIRGIFVNLDLCESIIDEVYGVDSNRNKELIKQKGDRFIESSGHTDLGSQS